MDTSALARRPLGRRDPEADLTPDPTWRNMALMGRPDQVSEAAIRRRIAKRRDLESGPKEQQLYNLSDAAAETIDWLVAIFPEVVVLGHGRKVPVQQYVRAYFLRLLGGLSLTKIGLWFGKDKPWAQLAVRRGEELVAEAQELGWLDVIPARHARTR